MALRASHNLPILPGARARALLLLHNPDATIHDFVQVFSADPALTVSALAAANSAASAPVRPIASVREAVVRIGAEEARHIAVSSLMRAQFDVRLDESWIEVGAFWEHCVVTGLVTEYLVDTAARGAVGPGVSFTAGFLHDLGRLALVSENPFRYRRVIDLAKAGASVGAAERRIFGATHLVAGERLARRWGLPEEIATAAEGHHGREGSSMAVAVGGFTPGQADELRRAMGAWRKRGGVFLRRAILLFIGFQVLLFLASVIGYFTFLPAFAQSPQDRYRLPIDVLLFMFAVFGLTSLLRNLRLRD